MLIFDEAIFLRPYTHGDDWDMYACWMDADTQKGYNGTFSESFEEFRRFDIGAFRFWATIVDRATDEAVGTLRLGPDDACPDLAIWIYPRFRGRGYGTRAFRLGVKYCFKAFGFDRIGAGCYADNARSRRMLEKIDFLRDPENDALEAHFLTGEETTQLSFVLPRARFYGGNGYVRD